jgi:hypothetical protein
MRIARVGHVTSRRDLLWSHCCTCGCWQPDVSVISHLGGWITIDPVKRAGEEQVFFLPLLTVG